MLRRRYRSVIAIFIPIVLSSVAFAASSFDDRDLLRCAAIADDAAKLKCFEALAAQAQSNLDTNASAPPPITSRQPNEPSDPGAEPERESEPDEAVGAALEAGDGRDEFGFASKRIADVESTALRARHAGEFRGWSGNTLFRLENGQLWQQVSPGRFFKVAQQPVITITQGALGSYWLSVEGANPRVRVTRIE